jgi:hypothetical protein
MTPTFIRVGLCCNDGRNGAPTGFAEYVAIDDVIQLEGDHTPVPCRRLSDTVLHIAGLDLPTFGYVTWYGNICWDGAVLTELDTWRLLEALRHAGWGCLEAQAELYDAWDTRRALEGPLRRALEGL